MQTTDRKNTIKYNEIQSDFTKRFYFCLFISSYIRLLLAGLVRTCQKCAAVFFHIVNKPLVYEIYILLFIFDILWFILNNSIWIQDSNFMPKIITYRLYLNYSKGHLSWFYTDRWIVKISIFINRPNSYNFVVWSLNITAGHIIQMWEKKILKSYLFKF